MAKKNKNGLIDIFGGVIDDVINKSEFLSENLGSVVETRNLEALKKKERRNGNFFYVTRQKNIGEGVYSVVDKQGEEIYNTLPEFGKSGNFVLHLYSDYGEIADITKRKLRNGGFLSALKGETEYYFRSNVYPPGAVIQVDQDDKRKYYTEFNNWMVMGDFKSGNYNFFDRDTGKSFASISKKFKHATTYSVQCRNGEDEPVIIFMTILIDMIEKE